MSNTTLFGTVRKLVTDKGFGFIAPDDASIEDHFLHVSQCRTSFEALQVGDRVTFQSSHDAKGYRAISVDLI